VARNATQTAWKVDNAYRNPNTTEGCQSNLYADPSRSQQVVSDGIHGRGGEGQCEFSVAS